MSYVLKYENQLAKSPSYKAARREVWTLMQGSSAYKLPLAKGRTIGDQAWNLAVQRARAWEDNMKATKYL